MQTLETSTIAAADGRRANIVRTSHFRKNERVVGMKEKKTPEVQEALFAQQRDVGGCIQSGDGINRAC